MCDAKTFFYVVPHFLMALQMLLSFIRYHKDHKCYKYHVSDSSTSACFDW